MKSFIIFLTIFTFCNNSYYLTSRKEEQHILITSEAAQYSTYISHNRNISKVNGLIVTLDEKTSGVNKIHFDTIFKEYNENLVKELTYIYNENALEFIDLSTYKQVFIVKEEFSDVSEVEHKIKELNKIKGVLCVEPAYNSEVVETETNDPYFQSNSLWNLEDEGCKAHNAWNINTGSKDVKVGVIDSGIYEHSDLRENLVEGYDFVNNNNITDDCLIDHGTHVAGIIGAVGNNNIGVVGVNRNVTLVPLQVEDAYRIYSNAAILSAINYATNTWGTNEQIDILNYSVSNFGKNTSVRAMVDNFPGLFVWSAGNNPVENLDESIYKNGSFDLDNLISVGALSESNNTRDDFKYSQSGENINIYAPGINVLSTSSNNGYSYKTGTSMAAPHVSGTAALMLSENPNLTSAQLKQKILENADEITTKVGPNHSITQTVKKLNTYNALMSVHNHTYNKSYVRLNDKQHKAFCKCGNFIKMGHFVSSDWNGVGITKCLQCGGRASVGFELQHLKKNDAETKFGLRIIEKFGNNSCLLENGIYVVSDEDLKMINCGLLKCPIINEEL